MRTRRPPGRITAFGAGLIALLLIAVATVLAFSKDFPFTTPYQLKAFVPNGLPQAVQA